MDNGRVYQSGKVPEFFGKQKRMKLLFLPLYPFDINLE